MPVGPAALRQRPPPRRPPAGPQGTARAACSGAPSSRTRRSAGRTRSPASGSPSLSSTNSVRVHVGRRRRSCGTRRASRSSCGCRPARRRAPRSRRADPRRCCGICFVFSSPMCVHVAPASVALVHAVAFVDAAARDQVTGADVDTFAVRTAPLRPRRSTSASLTLSKIGHQVAPALVVFHTPPAGRPM